MKYVIYTIQVLLCCTLLFGCNEKNKPVINDTEVLHQNEDQLTQIIIYDVFSPPVASRIYAYTSLASYEAIRFAKPGYASIAEKLNDFGKMPQPEKDKEYNYTLAASKAFCTVAYNIRIFSDTVLHRYEDSLENVFKEAIPEDVYNRSIAFGDTIGKTILMRAKKDMYKETRGMSKYLGSDADGRWQPTPPDYFDGTEPYWHMIKPFALDTASQFRPAPPFAYSKDMNSAFYKMIKEVYTVNKNLSDSQKTIANYWDDNPFVMQHSGHLMFANKKITPGGHWMGIAAIAARQTKSDAVKTAQAYACTAIALYDAFIACWDEKYRSNYIRPVTVINEKIDDGWLPFLQTPPFPEYTSGHSTITASAATVLTALYGEPFSFQDTSDLAYIGLQRHFPSFAAAAEEASISRVFGGIHYRFSVYQGAVAGKKLGNKMVTKLIH